MSQFKIAKAAKIKYLGGKADKMDISFAAKQAKITVTKIAKTRLAERQVDVHLEFLNDEGEAIAELSAPKLHEKESVTINFPFHMFIPFKIT